MIKPEGSEVALVKLLCRSDTSLLLGCRFEDRNGKVLMETGVKINED